MADVLVDLTAPLLQVEDLKTTFTLGDRQVEAVRGVSFRVGRGETMVLLGESGSGKSVTARSILRLYGPNTYHDGSARLCGVELMTMTEREVNQIRGNRIGLVSQDPGGALDPVRRVGAQVREALRAHVQGLTRGEATLRAEELFALVGLPDPRRTLRSYPHELSGGMKQRVVIALAVACEPDLLLADEPTTALDVTVQAQILELIGDLKQRLGMGTVLVTHDVGVARQMADRIAVMYAGRIVEAGPATEVLERPAHPYTAALLSSLPTAGAVRGSLRPIPGRPPLAGEIDTGCPFAPRCEHVVEECRRSEPELLAAGDDRGSACIRMRVEAGAQG